MSLPIDHAGQCPICRSHLYVPFFALTDVPLQDGVLWNSKEEALAAPTGDIALAYCQCCGYIGNLHFDADKIRYDHEYSFSLHYSPTYQAFMDTLASRLVGTYDLTNQTVLEIGCGQGDFLRHLCELGSAHGIGIDPSISSRQEKTGFGDITFIKDIYSEKYAGVDCRLICCRQVLDQLADPRAFVTGLRQNIGSRTETVVYCEVPNATNIFEDLLVRNIIYEKSSWFTPFSLRRLFELAGFTVLSVEPCFAEGQYVAIEAVPTRATPPLHNSTLTAPRSFAESVENFRARYETKIRLWKEQLSAVTQSGHKAIAWGAGSGAISFFSALDIDDEIPYVLDVNPKRQGKFLPRTGQQVVSPEFMRQYGADLVIVTNATYEHEIRQQVAEMDLEVAFWVI
jgi:SAM-dependent methyltransferase